jgi:hypothetical protein
MPTLQIGQPNAKQELFLTADKKYIAFGGARGGGKSWAVRMKAALLCLNYAGIKVMIIRKTYPELQENHIIPMCEMLNCFAQKKKDRIASYNDSKKHITFKNKSRILFRYCDKEKDAERFQGTEVDILFVDEATHQSEEKMKKLNACVRGVNDFPKRIYYTMNPGGEGHGWVKRLFIDRAFKENEKPDDYMFIQSLVAENKALMEADPDYVRQLEALPPKLRKAWLEGDWNVYEGQFFEDFVDRPEYYADRTWTHVIEPFEVPDGWKIYRSFDWGYNKPFSCGWWAVDYEGVAYRILELYGCTKIPNEGVKWTPPQVFAEIARIEREHRWLKGKKIIGIADPAIWNAETGKSIADVAADHSVFFQKGDHERIAGWMQVHYRFAFDENGFPMMYVFNNCKAFIRTMPLLQYDEHKPEDLDTDGEDHVADEVRYFLMSRPIKPRAAAKPDDFAKNPLNIFLDIGRDDIREARSQPRMEIISGGRDG